MINISFKKFKNTQPYIENNEPENIKSSSVEPSLLARVEELPTAEEAGVLPIEQITQEEEEV